MIGRVLRLSVVIKVVALAMAAYHLAYTQFFFQGPMLHLNTHYAFALVLVFLTTMEKLKKKWWPLILVLILLSLVATGYVKVFCRDLELRAGFNTPVDMVVGVALVLLALEASRELFGLGLPVIVAILLSYGPLASYLPEPLHGQAIPLDQIIAMWSIGFRGIYDGEILGASANLVFLFVLFGGLLQASGASEFFLKIGRLAGRWFRGGPGISAIVSSALVGTVTGSPMANVTITGAFSIPLMKKVGYKPHQAGAIEAAASTGGIIMPPIMGTVAFLMAGYAGVPYAKICASAVIPAILYYYVLGAYVQIQAVKLNISAPREQVNFKELLLDAPLFIVPFAFIVILLVWGYTPGYIAFWAIMILIATSLIMGLITRKRLSLSRWIKGFVDGSVAGAGIAVACACMGPVASTFVFTGMGFKLPVAVESFVGGNVFLALVMIMIVTIILGAPLPSFVSYLLVAITLVPVLMRLNIPLLQAHFFVLFYAAFAGLSPPIALTSLVASQMAGATYWKTANESCKVASAGFLLPFLIIWAPVLILEEVDILSGAMGLISSIVVLSVLAILVSNHFLIQLSVLELILFLVTALSATLSVIMQSLPLLALGLVLFTLLTIGQRRRRLRRRLSKG